jgi:hypothetical protein
MIYLGGQTKGESVEIVIMQQHCGGQNLIVFKDLVKPNGSIILLLSYLLEFCFRKISI